MKSKEEIRKQAKEQGYSKTLLALINERKAIQEEIDSLYEKTRALEKSKTDCLHLMDSVFEDIKQDKDVDIWNLKVEGKNTLRVKFTDGDTLVTVDQDSGYNSEESISFRIRIKEEPINIV